MLKIHESTVYAWASQGKIPSVTLSRKALRFREKDIQEFIERKLIHPEAQPYPPLKTKPIKQKKSASAKIMGFNGEIQRYIESARREVLGHA